MATIVSTTDNVILKSPYKCTTVWQDAYVNATGALEFSGIDSRSSSSASTATATLNFTYDTIDTSTINMAVL